MGDETKNLVDVINLNDSVLDYTKYIQVGMKAIDWCDANGIIIPKLTAITGLSRFGHSVWNLWNFR